MPTKSIDLKESTYRRLNNAKQDGERAADVVRRLLDEHGAGGRDDAIAQLAEGALTLDDLAAIDRRGTDPVEYLAAEYGVDAGEYDDALELRAAVQGDGGRPAAARPDTATDRDTAGDTAADHGTATDGGAEQLTARGGNVDPSTEQLAESVLTLGDVQAADQQGIGAAEYLADEYGVDASRYRDETALLDAVRSADGGAGR